MTSRKEQEVWLSPYFDHLQPQETTSLLVAAEMYHEHVLHGGKGKTHPAVNYAICRLPAQYAEKISADHNSDHEFS